MRRILFIWLLIALVGGVQAEELINYSEDIGPYVVSFSLPKLQSGPVEFERNISQTETLSGIVDDTYDLSMYSGGRMVGFLIIDSFNFIFSCFFHKQFKNFYFFTHCFLIFLFQVIIPFLY